MAFSVSSNSPSVGHIAWSGVHLVYEGVDYSIANASTDKKFVYWLKAQPGTFQVSDTYPAISADDCIVFLNKGGVPISVLTATATDGDLVVPGTITSSAIATEAIDATHIKSDAIIARHILAGAITAEKLSVNELSAISANMGTMTAGNFTLNATGFIKGGASSYAAGNGFWMGYDGGYYKFRAGTPGSSRMEWDGTAFNIYGPDGSLTISSGVVDYTKLASKPQSLSDISSTEGQKLSTVQDGATRNVFRGDHAMGVTYVQGDLVLDASGYGWSCLQTHISDATNQPPTHPVESNAFWSIYIIRGADGADGVSGVNGTRTAVLEMYRWSAAAPTTFPSGTSTYTWATGQFTAPATVNGWSLTPPAPVAGQTLWVVRQAYADTATDATSAVTWTAASSRSLAAAGTNGTRTAVLELYQWAASAPTSFPSGTSTYTWATGAFSAPTTSNGWSLAPGAAAPGQTLWGCSVSYADTGTSTTSTVTWNTTVTYALGAAGSTGPTGPAGADGVGGIVAVLSNEAHVFPASSTGVVSSYVGSGTEIRVFEGATALVYDGAGTANGTWTFTSSATNITRGTITDSGTFATVGAHSGVASGTDLSSITYTISGKSSSGASFSLSKAQSFSKSKTGTDGATGPTGAPGPAVTITSSRETTFISTDAILDPDQTAISLTASTSGIESPTYVWTFSGFQTNPVASTSAIQVISPADFGTSKSAVVTCTVNGTHKDQVTIVRLERALETGAFRETFVSATNASVAADWQNYAGSGEVSVVSAPDGIGGNSLYIGNNSGDDQAWLIKKQKIPFDSNTLYRVSCRLRRRAGTGTIYIGLAGVAADGVTLINSTGSNTHSGQHYVAASAASPANSTSQWTTYVGYVKGETLSGVAGGGLANNITTPAKMYFGTRYVRPLILANYQSLAGTVEVDYFEVTPLPSTMAGIDQITSDNASTVIANAAIGSAQIGSVALVGTSNFSVKTAVSGARMEMDSRAIKVYDASGIKRIQIGDLTV